MRNTFTLILFCVLSAPSHADIFHYFRNPNGSTKWQYVANFSSSVLILTLLIVATFLLLANRRAGKANRELTEIKATLEDRVARRTASLIETTENLKSREEYITSIVESMPLMLIGLDQDMKIVQWNRVAETSTGRPLASVLGKNLWEAYPAIALNPEQVQQVLATKQTTTIKHSQRDQYYFDITLYTVSDKDNTSVVILVDDITKQMKAENKVSERDKMSAMGELASAMAYDIQLPLQSLASDFQQVKTNLDSDNWEAAKVAINQQLQHAQQSSQQASDIVQNLLDLANSHHDSKIPATISALMDESILLADKLFTDNSGLSFSQITINRNYQTELPQIPCFRSELQQVFVRLLRNAFHSLNRPIQKNPVINIEISEFYDSLWIKLQHNGRVLSAQEQEDIFQPFFSISNRPPACAVEHRMSYSYFIITDHHDGQMSVTSDERFGTSFNIQLPLV